MPVDRAVLEKYIAEVAGDDAELRTIMLDKLGSKEDAAVRFTGGFLRNEDYTRKRQEESEALKKANTLAENYQTQLTQSESRIRKIMDDLADQKINRNKAEVLLDKVKEMYQLSDEDIPSMKDLRNTENLGNVVDSRENLDTRMKSFKEELMKEIRETIAPELTALADVSAVQGSIYEEHQNLFGKPMTREDRLALNKEATTSGRRLMDVWADKYKVADKKLEIRLSDHEKELRAKWDAEQVQKNSEAALETVRNQEGNPNSMFKSPVFRDYQTHDEKTYDDSGNKNAPGPHVTDERGNQNKSNGRRKDGLRGAEAAAAEWVRKSQLGIIGVKEGKVA